MLTEQEALARILKAISILPCERLSLPKALLQRAAKPVFATVALPGFDNSAMDGYAVRAAETQSKTPLHVIAKQPAGKDQQLMLPPHSAIRIFTGAPMPRGADAVIMQEDVQLVDGSSIVCTEPVEAEENVRFTGCDLFVGQKIVEARELLTPAKLAVLATQGLTEIEMVASPKIAIVSTGDELVPAGQPLEAGQIYNSNAVMLEALVKQHANAEVTLAHFSDDLPAITEGLGQLIVSHDFVILSGGVSVGDHDCVKPALAALGIKPDFWRVKIKPGKPLLFAQAGRCQIFGLPGNPVSAFVTYQVFVRPALSKATGASESSIQPTTVPVTLSQNLKNTGDRPHYLRGKVIAGVFTQLGSQQSHALFGLSQGNALLRLEAEEEREAGEVLEALLY
jgi:molybdopterin molybdotransferase